MKKIIKTFLIIYLFFGFIGYVYAETYALNEDEAQNGEPVVPDNALVIGTHLITDSSKASTQLIMDATQTIVGDDAIIFQKILDKEEADDEEEYPEGWWINAISGDDMVPSNVEGLICITHLNGDEVEDPDCDATRFSVKFSGITGEEGEKTVYIKNGEKIASADIPTPKTKKGYEFVCWVVKGTKNETHDSCYDFSKTISANVELDPYYDLIKYKIKFDLNGLDSSSQQVSDQTCTIEELASPEDSNCTLPELHETRKGYKFDGWSTVKDETGETGTHFEANSSMADMLGDEYNITLYAVWTPETYEITYNLDGGTYEDQTTLKSSYTILTKDNIELFTPSRTGYTFAGWKITNPSESGGNITGPEENEGKYKLSVGESLQALTLTAQWKEKEYTITYEVNTESLQQVNANANSRVYATMLANLQNPANTTCKFKSECTLAAAPEDENFLFGGWQNDDGYLFSASGDYRGVDFGDDKSTVELEAVWFSKNEPVYNITYDLRGGSFNLTPVSTYGSKTTGTQLPKPTRVGYTFKGWCTDEARTQCTGINTINDALGQEKTPKDITLYAKWEAITYDVQFVTFNSIVGGFLSRDEVINTVTCTYDKPCPLGDHSEYFKNKHKKLLGWSLSEYVVGNYYQSYFSDNISVINVTSISRRTVKLYAVTADIKYHVTYYPEGGSFQTEKEVKTEYTDGEKLKLPELSEREGYTFDGWYKLGNNSLAEEKIDKENQDVSVTSDMVLVAKWKKDVEWSLNIYLDGGRFSEGQTTLTNKKYKDGSSIEIPNPTKEGYTFIGWVDDEGNSVPEKKSKPESKDKTTIIINKDLFLIAKWQQNNPELKLSLERSTTANNQILYKYKIDVKSNNRKGFRTKLKLTIKKGSQKSDASNTDVEVSYGDQVPGQEKELLATLKQDFKDGTVIISPEEGIILEEKLGKYLSILVKQPETYYIKVELVDYNDENKVYASYEVTAVSASGSVTVPLQKGSS